MVLLNVSLGDRAVVSRRRCGCPLEGLGWTTHLSMVRSFEKLTAGGVTFLDSALIRLLEETLPARFGGGPLDYQLVEEEAEDGLPRVRLLVSDAVPAVDLAGVAHVLYETLTVEARSSALLWRQGRWLRVERGPVAVTRSGKVHHLVAGGAAAGAARVAARDG
jgi:hypothetical protein